MELFSDTDKWMKVKIPVHTQDWHDFRTTGYTDENGVIYHGGIGASEVSKLFSGFKVFRPLLQEVFYHKIGMEKPTDIQNENIYWGTQDEAGVIHAWQFWDGQIGSYVQNHKKWRESGEDPNMIFRKAEKCGYYLINRKYPWLFVSLDAAIPPGAMNMITREPLTKPAPLEAKTIGYYAGQAYEDQVPFYHIVQLHAQMIVTESDYGEIVLKRDGQKLDVKYYQRDEKLCKQILRLSEDFWMNRVIPARRLWQEAKYADDKQNLNKVEKYTSAIMQLEPEVDDSELYREYQAEKFQKERVRRKGKLSEFKKMNDIFTLKQYRKEIQKLITLNENQIRDVMVKDMVEELTFAKEGYFRYLPYKSSMRLYTKFNEDPDSSMIEDIVKKLPLEL